MDIREWLQNTADREPPDEQDRPNFPDVPPPQLGASRPVRTDYRHKRKREYSDPLVDNAHQKGHGLDIHRQRTAQSGSSGHVRLEENGAGANSSSVSKRSRVLTKLFERRTRHKTRPDRYHFKPKKPKEHDQDRERESKKSKRRRSHRSGDGARTTGLVQSFRLKNGPKNNRLTLRPEASAGIFNNGRASVPMAASGPGLPDLVFNEMKFLSNSKDHREHLAANEAAKKIKKTRKELREEEVSAYFRCVTAERHARHSQIRQAPSDQSLKQTAIEPVPPVAEHVEHNTTLRPPLELLERPSLGFGSKGVPLEDSANRTYYTWSESIAPKARASPDRHQHIPPRSRFHANLPSRRESQLSHASNTSPPQQRRQQACRILSRGSGNHAGALRQIQKPHARRKSTVNVYVAPPEQSNSREHVAYLESALGTASLSIRQRRATETPRLPIDDHRWGADFHHTSDILNLRDTCHPRYRSSSLPRDDRGTYPSAHQEKPIAITSTPTSKLLRDALNAVTWHEQNLFSSSRRDNCDATVHTVQKARPEVMAMAETSQLVGAAQYVDEHGAPLLLNSREGRVPHRGFNRMCESIPSQARMPPRSASATNSNGLPNPHPISLAPFPKRLAHQLVDGVEILDNSPDFRWSVAQNGIVHVSCRQAEDLVLQLARNEVPSVYGQRQGLGDDQNEFHNLMHFDPDHSIPLSPKESPSIQMEVLDEQAYHEENSLLEPWAEHEPAHTMGGFWKPNMLY